jgi:hypothetical protein
MLAAQLFMVDVQITTRAANLASPAISLQYQLPQLQVATQV